MANVIDDLNFRGLIKEYSNEENVRKLFDTKQTIIYRAYAVDEKGKYDKDIGYCYYLRTEDGRWFGANSFWACELDVDNRWYNLLHGVRTIKV